MKTLLATTAAVLITASAAFAQSTISAPAVHHRAYAPVVPAETEGALQRGARVGNPLQIINPTAPEEYGDGSAFVTPRDEDIGLRPRDTSRPLPIGLRLFTLTF